MSAPESDLKRAGTFDYAFNSLALTDNDANPGVPVDVFASCSSRRSATWRKSSDDSTISAEGYSTNVWSGRSPSATSGSQGWTASSDGWTSARRGQAPPTTAIGRTTYRIYRKPIYSGAAEGLEARGAG